MNIESNNPEQPKAETPTPSGELERKTPSSFFTKRRIAFLGVGVFGIIVASFAAYRWLHEKPLSDDQEQNPRNEHVETVRIEELVAVTDAAIAPGANELDGAVDAGSQPQLIDVITEPPEAIPSNSSFSHTRNLLVVGVDKKPWGSGGSLADTIMLVAMDPETNHAGILSVPRDFYVDFGRGNFGRINTAFSAAGQNGLGRLDFMRRVVGNLLSIRIQHIVTVDISVLEKAIDIVDGVNVVVPCPIMDNFVDPRTETGRRILNIPAGTVHMDGFTAAMYARSRHGRSDWDRARRQQGILLALRRRITSASGLALLPRLLDEVSQHVQTDMSRAEILETARFAASIEPNQLHGMVLASSASQAYRTPTGQSVLIPNREAIINQSRGLFHAPSPGASPERSRCPDTDVAIRENAPHGRAATSTPDPNAPPPPIAPPAVNGPATPANPPSTMQAVAVPQTTHDTSP